MWWEGLSFAPSWWKTPHLKKIVKILWTQMFKCPQTSWGKKSVIEVPRETDLTHLQKLASFTKEYWKNLCSVFARHKWWFWNSLLFGIVLNFTVWRSNRDISWQKRAFDFGIKSRMIFSRRLHKKIFASLLGFFLWNTELIISETVGRNICGFTSFRIFCLLNTSIWRNVS